MSANPVPAKDPKTVRRMEAVLRLSKAVADFEKRIKGGSDEPEAPRGRQNLHAVR